MIIIITYMFVFQIAMIILYIFKFHIYAQMVSKYSNGEKAIFYIPFLSTISICNIFNLKEKYKLIFWSFISIIILNFYASYTFNIKILEILHIITLGLSLYIILNYMQYHYKCEEMIRKKFEFECSKKKYWLSRLFAINEQGINYVSNNKNIDQKDRTTLNYLLSIITLGIWNIVWIFKLQNKSSQKRFKKLVLVANICTLGLFANIYSIKLMLEYKTKIPKSIVGFCILLSLLNFSAMTLSVVQAFSKSEVG